MIWAITHNQRPINLNEIPCLPYPELREGIMEQVTRCHRRPINWLAVPENDIYRFYAVLADDESSRLQVASCLMTNTAYSGLTADIPAFHGFEREIYEQYGIKPINHPWLKPWRYPFDRKNRNEGLTAYPFFEPHGEGIHQVAVGPIHAGVIEPGHFRFMCRGEMVHHLEIQLGYQHRGVEHLIDQGHRNQRNMIHLAESICGDSVIGHGTAYAGVLESLSGRIPDRRDMAMRSIALELERIGIHIGDLSAIANDIAYLLGNAVFGALRTLVINTSLALCGSRFGRGLIRIGYNAHQPSSQWLEHIDRMLTKVDRDFSLMAETMLSAPSVLSRLEKTGILSMDDAQALGMTGPAARASGLAVDCRCDHPFGWYKTTPIYKIKLAGGDVFARTYIRYIEIKQSIDYIRNLLIQLPERNRPVEPDRPTAGLPALQPSMMVISMVEGWRGEICHIGLTDPSGCLNHYKIKEPSFHNWHGLALAVRENGISDFPLCNKSF
ncbi:MAG: hypothetical protein KBA26_15395, partial [Candidatus Delongbacteria bacterium]|nr:hypothetical protein [Candidatus Delongbacteria bacterium]